MKVRFTEITLQRDYESGQLAAIRGKHSDDCPFRLPGRRAAWQRGFRDTTYQSEAKTPQTAQKFAQRNVNELRNILKR
ncbi:ribosome modulation factor [Thalassotalea piscium]|uniref:Ribosome modulation factor n=1 Tax=Thalassotalea piscium TaxID=1230533 RepID=A0A7X0TT56_9GAMM|nr:ribosome modulation factor [Thalassotalea piscium]